MVDTIDRERKITSKKVISGGFWFYLDSILLSAIGYFYWVLIGILTGPEDGPMIIGFASATISFTLIIKSIVNFGIPEGIQRFFGLSYGRNDRRMLKTYFISAFSLVGILALIAAVSIYVFNKSIGIILGIDSIYIFYAGILIFIASVREISKSYLVSVLQTKTLFLFDSFAQVIRLSVGLFLVIIGFGGIGAVLGIVISSTVLTIILLSYTFLILRKYNSNETCSFDTGIIKEIYKAGRVAWLPSIINVVGIQFGVLILFGMQGATSTGVYYIAFSIFLIFFTLPNTFLSLLFPVLSALEDGHISATKRTLNLTLVVSAPIAAIIWTYSYDILSMISITYASGSIILSILALSIPLACIVNGIRSFAFAKGQYQQVLLIGIVMSITQLIFYFYLVPSFGGIGAAISFVSGYITSFVIAVFYSYKYELSINYIAFLTSILIPFGIAYILQYFLIVWYLSCCIIILTSVIIFARAHIFTLDDIRDISQALLPKYVTNNLAPKLYPILKILFGD